MKIHQEKLPMNKGTEDYIREEKEIGSQDQERQMMVVAMQEVLERFSSLPEKLQDDIIEDIKKQRGDGVGYKEISNRVKLLVQKGEELSGMEIDNTDDLIKELEERRKRKEIEDSKKEPKKNTEEKPRVEKPKKEWIN